MPYRSWKDEPFVRVGVKTDSVDYVTLDEDNAKLRYLERRDVTVQWTGPGHYWIYVPKEALALAEDPIVSIILYY